MGGTSVWSVGTMGEGLATGPRNTGTRERFAAECLKKSGLGA